MDIVWLALTGAFFLMLVGLAAACDRLLTNRKYWRSTSLAAPGHVETKRRR